MCHLTLQIALLLLYHAVAILFALSFAKTIKTPPGCVPPSFRLTDDEVDSLAAAKSEAEWKQMLERVANDAPGPVRQRSVQGAARFCEVCRVIKPDRAHHCSVCERCVLKMDHHCPWVNNCVGYANYKFFYLFLVYAYAYCLILIGSMAEYVVALLIGLEDIPTSEMVSYHLLFIFVIAALFFLFLSSLFWYHTFLLLRNRTTLEQFRAPTFTYGADDTAFDLGKAENFKQVFGDRPLGWFLPWDTTKGNGLAFPMRRGEASFTAIVNHDIRRHGAESGTEMVNGRNATEPTLRAGTSPTTPVSAEPSTAPPGPMDTKVYYHNETNNVIRSTFTMSANETQV